MVLRVSRLRVLCFSFTLDGYSAGPRQHLQKPLGVGGPAMMTWFMHSRTWQTMQGGTGGETGVDDEMAAKSFEAIC